MIADEPLPLDPCYPLQSDSLHALRHKRLAQFLALKKAQSEVRILLDDLEYLDHRIEVARECVQDEMNNGSCGFGSTADFYQP